MKYLVFFVLGLLSGVMSAQEIMVVHIDGEAYVMLDDQETSTYDKLVLGDLPSSATILVKSNSTVRLIADKSSYVDLEGEASYELADLVFQESDSKGMFAKFCKYFSDFFAGHSSAEAKSSYRNRIYAVSRGKASIPSLDFPLEGDLPYVDQSMTFSWTHGCQDCKYVFQIVDYKSRSSVFAETTSSHSITLDNVNEYLSPSSRYYWSVAISGVELDYQKIIFDTTAEGDYGTMIDAVRGELDQMEFTVSPSGEVAYVMQRLQEQGLTNYAIYYGQQKVAALGEQDASRHLVEQAWYSYLINSY